MTQKQIKFYEPDSFHLRDFVYVVCGPDTYIQTQIFRFVANIFFHTDADSKSEEMIAYPMGVVLEAISVWDYFEDVSPDCVPLCYLTNDEEEAKAWVKTYPVLCSEEEWMSAIGDRDIPDSIEDCELGLCCATISDIRDLLMKCKKQGNLIGWERSELIEIMSDGSHGKDEYFRPNLTKIFDQLNILPEHLKV